MASDRRAYMKEYMRRYRETHAEKYAAYKRRKVLRYAQTHSRVPTTGSIRTYDIKCDELSSLFVTQINHVCKPETFKR
eukprot:4445100-Prymnesium_polylepis.1